MSTQLLFYERVVPVSKQRHASWSVETGRFYAFARHVNSVPLMSVEFPAAVREHTIVFARVNDAVMPVVMLGVEGRENLYITDSGGWDARYIPAFVRRYPFVFARSDDGRSFTLCIDETWAGCNQEDRGERLFTDAGERAPYLEKVLGFLQDYQAQYRVTQQFCGKLRELDLLEEMRAQFTLPGGEQRSLTGFLAVNRERLKALPGEKLSELARSDELLLVYAHLQSLNNFSLMMERAAKRHGTPTPAQAAPAGAG